MFRHLLHTNHTAGENQCQDFNASVSDFNTSVSYYAKGMQPCEYHQNNRQVPPMAQHPPTPQPAENTEIQCDGVTQIGDL